MRLDWLESFVVFAEELNFTRAAARLHVSQPALHVQIKRLTEDLELTLYRREGRGLVLTEKGRQLEAKARELLARRLAMRAELTESEDPSVARLVAGEGTLLHLLAGSLRDWVQKTRRIELRRGSRDEALQDVLQGRAHLGVAPLAEIPASITARRLTSIGSVAVLPRDHRLARRKRLDPTDLQGESLILPAPDRPHRAAVAGILEQQGIDFDVVVETGGWDLMMQFASLGMGVAIVNDYCRPPTRAVAIPLSKVPRLDFHLFHPKVGFMSPAARELKDHLLRSL